MKRALLLLALIAAPVAADPSTPPAALANTQLRDPAQEAKARDLMATLRCLVCQGQSIADSDASMAGDPNRSARG
jgi:cytochrome c-type biogenesis protein CcmH